MIQRQYRLAAGFGFIGLGVVVAILGYLGVSEETEVAFQLPYFASAAVGALMLLGFGATLLLSVQLERDSETIADLEDAVRQLTEEVARLSDEVTPARGAPTGNGRRRSGAKLSA